MGRGKSKGKGKGKGQKTGRRDNRNGQNGPNGRYQTYANIIKENARLESYYDAMLGLESEEKEQFWEVLRRELPNSFRFCGSKGHALAVQKLLRTRYIPEITKITHEDGQSVSPPEPVPWYPDSLAWWMTTPKNVVRKFPPFAAFQRFLVSETNVGNISRQEVVSMIPPLLMDVRPGMAVLDLCAAPGSKSAQLLEMIHAGEESRLRNVLLSLSGQSQDASLYSEGGDAADLTADTSDDGRATGLLVANDMDYKRCHLLIHQLKRLSSPNMIVTNHDATLFPSLRIPNPENPSQTRYLKFDRILADVPCTGDGTLRKNADLWKSWQPANALGLHLTQVRILVRALQMLKVGGRVVYSTCSMNPVENEAVVAAAIDRCGGLEKISIVDCQDQLPGLLRRPGLKSWQIMDKSGRMWRSWKEVEEFAKSTEGGIVPGRLVETMFPSPPGTECSDLPLDRCMRIYAHLQDTGAFFITVLEKKIEFKAKSEEARKPEARAPPTNGPKRGREENELEGQEETKRQRTDEPGPTDESRERGTAGQPPKPQENNEEAQNAPPAERRRKPDGPYEEPFKYLPADNAVIQDVTRFYNISSRFPSDRYMVRNALGEPTKAIYYTSALVRDILTLNEGRAVRFIHAGVRMFMKQDAPSAEVCRWRIQSEGMPILHAYVGPDRIVVLRKKETLRKLLIEMFPKIVDGFWADLDEIGERVRDMGMGCYVVRIEPDGDDEEFSERMVLPLWKSFHSLNLMLPKEDRSAMLLRIFNDTTPLKNMGLQRKEKIETGREDGAKKAELPEGGSAAEEMPFENGVPLLDEATAEDGEEVVDGGHPVIEANDDLDEDAAYIAEDAPSD